MLGIEDYGSGSDSDGGERITKPTTSKKAVTRPSSSVPTSGSSLALPPPKRAAKKITIGLPALSKPKSDGGDDDQDERPQAKRPRLEAGAGVSGLMSMLPAPKQKTLPPPAPERVLGGGKGKALTFDWPIITPNDVSGSNVEGDWAPGASQSEKDPVAVASSGFLPPSLQKKRPNISLEDVDSKPKAWTVSPKKEDPAMDFFSLSNPTSSKITLPNASSSTSSTLQISSALAVPTFEPPEPTPTDEYPGYYQLPSGQWAAHDPAYYAKFVEKWQKEYEVQIRALEKGAAKGFEGYDTGAVEEVDAMEEMEKAKLESRIREERKAVTQGAAGAPAQPKMKITASKMSGIARSRHQLSTLLKEAYENREALEEKIAQGKRNRKEAGNKYGF